MTTIPVEDWFTADDLDSLPDDGNRFELLDGELLVTPSPRVVHQAVSVELAYRLRQALPQGLSRDLVLTRRAYEREGVCSYWIVDPGVPSLTALELQDGAYAEVARVEGNQPWTATLPYPVMVVPDQLLR